MCGSASECVACVFSLAPFSVCLFYLILFLGACFLMRGRMKSVHLDGWGVEEDLRRVWGMGTIIRYILWKKKLFSIKKNLCEINRSTYESKKKRYNYRMPCLFYIYYIFLIF